MSMDTGTHVHFFAPGRDPAAPPLLLLHGTGGDEHDLVPLARRLSPDSAILAPRGNVSEHGARRFFRRFAEGVFDLDDVRRRTHELADFLTGAAAHYGLGGTRLTVLGFSNGANMGASLLLLRPEMLEAAALLRPMVVLPEAAPAGSLQGRRVLLLNGSQDPIVPPGHPGRLAALLRAGGAEVTTQLVRGGHGLTSEDVAGLAQWFSPAPPAGDRRA